jgi:hypothetical protein
MGPVTRFDAADGAPLAVGFNQDATCVALADGGGVRVWSLRGGGVVFSADVGGVR